MYFVDSLLIVHVCVNHNLEGLLGGMKRSKKQRDGFKAM